MDMPPDMVVGMIVGVAGAALCTGVSVAAAASVGQAVSCASSARETVFFISSPPSVRRYKANRYRQHRASPPTMIALSFFSISEPPFVQVYCASRQIMLYLQPVLWYDLFAGGYCVMLTMNIQKMRCDYAYYLPSERSMFAAF